MKKLVYLILGCFLMYPAKAQTFRSNYHWKWSVLNSTCPPEIPNFPTGLDFSKGPKCMAIDSMGNVFLFGLMEVPDGLDYELAANTSGATSHTQSNPYTTNTNTALYLMKLSNSGELLWSKNIATAGIWEGMDLSLHVDALSSISHILFNAGPEIKLNHDFIRTPYPSGTSGTLMSFNSDGDLIDTVWQINHLIPGDGASFLYIKPGPWPQQFTVIKRTSNTERELTIFNYSVPEFIYNPHANNFYSFRTGYIGFQIYDTALVLQKNVQITGTTPNMLGTDFKAAFGSDGHLIILYRENAFTNWMLYVDSNYECKWYRKAGDVAALDADGNPWIYYPSAILIDGKRVVPFRGETCVAVKLNKNDGSLSGDFVAPTYASYSKGADDFIIDHKNNFYMAGTFRYEIEFGNTLLSQICSNRAFAKTQFVAMAQEGKEPNRLTADAKHQQMAFKASVYPIPFTEQLSVQSDLVMDKLKIHDLHGKQLLETSPYSTLVELDLRSLKAGIYLLSIQSDDLQTHRRIVKY